MENLKEVLMRRDQLTEVQAARKIAQARKILLRRLDAGELTEDFMLEQFDLEPDYLPELPGGLL